MAQPSTTITGTATLTDLINLVRYTDTSAGIMSLNTDSTGTHAAYITCNNASKAAECLKYPQAKLSS